MLFFLPPLYVFEEYIMMWNKSLGNTSWPMFVLPIALCTLLRAQWSTISLTQKNSSRKFALQLSFTATFISDQSYPRET